MSVNVDSLDITVSKKIGQEEREEKKRKMKTSTDRSRNVD